MLFLVGLKSAPKPIFKKKDYSTKYLPKIPPSEEDLQLWEKKTL